MKKILIIFIAAVIAHASVSLSYAQEVSLGIYPPVVLITGKPGNSIKTPLIIENYSNDEQSLNISIKEFAPSPKSDGMVLLTESSRPFSDLLRHIQLLDQDIPIERFILAPKQKKELILKINVPENTPDRDFTFSCIFTQEGPRTITVPENTSISRIIGAIGANVILSINTDTLLQSAEIEDFSSPSLAEHGPVGFSVRIRNTGKHIIRPYGFIYIRNIFGQLVGRIPLGKQTILSGTSRYYSINENPALTSKSSPVSSNYNQLTKTVLWNEAFLLGPYQATLDLALSDNGTSLNRSIYFFAVPYKLIAIALIVLLLISLIAKRVNKYLSSV